MQYALELERNKQQTNKKYYFCIMPDLSRIFLYRMTHIKNIPHIHINGITCLMKNERVKLTPARAMLLSVLFDLVRDGEFVSEFAAEKVAYFLQRFGAKEYFKLEFQPNFYGPYSGKVKRVLYYLNGSYITGYSSMDKKPFEELGLMTDGEIEVNAFLDENIECKQIVEKTKKFLSRFYSPFGLELLSTVDFIIQEKKVTTIEEITEEINHWSSRKSTMFNKPQYIQKAVNHLQSALG